MALTEVPAQRPMELEQVKLPYMDTPLSLRKLYNELLKPLGNLRIGYGGQTQPTLRSVISKPRHALYANRIRVSAELAKHSAAG